MQAYLTEYKCKSCQEMYSDINLIKYKSLMYRLWPWSIYCSARIWYNCRLSHSCLSEYFAIKHSQLKGTRFYLHLCYVIECAMELSLWKYYSIILIRHTAESDEVKSDWGLAVYLHPKAVEELVISKGTKAALTQVSVHWVCLPLSWWPFL